MITIEIKDFQSIEEIKFSVEGPTAIVGRSNIGKSAVVRALKCALTNGEGTSFVRHGPECERVVRGMKSCKCQSSVHIVMDGFDLLWEKGDAVNRYLFNKVKYDKPGKGLPDFLADSGFSPVKIGDSSSNIQVANQFYPIFLLNQYGGVIAETISDVARLDRINKATRMVEKDRREAASTKKVRETDAEQLRTNLKVYEGLDAALHKVSEVEDSLSKVDAAEGRVEVLKEFVTKTSNLVIRIRAIANVDSVAIPDIDEVTAAQDRVGALSKFVTDFDRRTEAHDSLVWVESLEDKIPSIKGVQDLRDSVSKLGAWIDRLRTLKAKFQALESVTQKDLSPIDPINELKASIMAMSGFSARHSSLQGTVTSLEDQLKEIELEEKQVSGELNEFDVCPTCVQPFTLGHAHA